MTHAAAKARPSLPRPAAFWAAEAGSTAMAYALIASVVAMLGIGGVKLIAGEIGSLLSSTVEAFTTATSGLHP
jgi:Flp pilus assembly pilin Flp